MIKPINRVKERESGRASRTDLHKQVIRYSSDVALRHERLHLWLGHHHICGLGVNEASDRALLPFTDEEGACSGLPAENYLEDGVFFLPEYGRLSEQMRETAHRHIKDEDLGKPQNRKDLLEAELQDKLAWAVTGGLSNKPKLLSYIHPEILAACFRWNPNRIVWYFRQRLERWVTLTALQVGKALAYGLPLKAHETPWFKSILGRMTCILGSVEDKEIISPRVGEVFKDCQIKSKISATVLARCQILPEAEIYCTRLVNCEIDDDAEVHAREKVGCLV